MSYFNQVILMGYVGGEPQFSEEGKKPFARFSLATNKVYKQNDKKVEQTHWHNLICFNGTADVVKQYVKTGSHIQVIGELTNNKWEDSEGNQKQNAVILVNKIILLGAKADIAED